MFISVGYAVHKEKVINGFPCFITSYKANPQQMRGAILWFGDYEGAGFTIDEAVDMGCRLYDADPYYLKTGAAVTQCFAKKVVEALKNQKEAK